MDLIKCLVGQKSCHVVPYLVVQIVEKLSIHTPGMYTFPPPAGRFLDRRSESIHPFTLSRKQNCSVAMQHSVNASSRHDVIR